jgi:hypothetical protein
LPFSQTASENIKSHVASTVPVHYNRANTAPQFGTR